MMIHIIADRRGRLPSEVAKLPMTEILDIWAYFDVKASLESQARAHEAAKAKAQKLLEGMKAEQ